jgi:hypothetical protein
MINPRLIDREFIELEIQFDMRSTDMLPNLSEAPFTLVYTQFENLFIVAERRKRPHELNTARPYGVEYIKPPMLVRQARLVFGLDSEPCLYHVAWLLPRCLCHGA